MENQRFEVAVVGTGVVGLAAALGFAQLGLQVAFVGPRPREAAAAGQLDLRVYALAPASVALLERLGVWSHIDAARTASIERMRIFGDGGDELTFDAYAAAVARLATIVEESELLRVLGSGCRFQPKIVAFDSAFAGMLPAARGHWLELADGRRLQAELVIGADGAHSAVRAAGGISADEQSYGAFGIVANFACERPHLDTAWQWFTDEGVVALLPLPKEQVSLVWSAPAAVADGLLALTPDELAARVTARSEGALGRLTALGAAASFPLRLLSVAHPVQPGIALVGDAAHVVHPLAGQGLNLGLQDVATLLDVVAGREADRPLGDLPLLRRYQRQRAEAVGLMRAITDGLQRLFAADDPWSKTARNAGLSIVNRAGLLKRLLIRQALG